ncbi:PAS domain-containing protein [Piscinibacter sp.]|jgi:PAS domain S-box-containing protein|uniref:hybrid sensor histidine kinase/response regulator n=1 Tax=Piscinibacter sp. TaxID=1903157 RepID=UPI00355A796C
MDQLWLSAPALAIRVWRDDAKIGWRANSTALDWAASRGVGTAQWQALADELAARCEAGAERGALGVQLGGEALRCTVVPMGAGWLVWLVPRLPAATPPQDNAVLERMRAQEERSSKLTRAVNLASVSVWHIDLATRRIQYNEQGYRMAGMAPQPEGVPLDAVRATIHPDDVAAVVRAADEAMAGNGVIDVEARYRQPDGSYRHLLTRRVAERDAEGRVVALAGISIDQTQQIAERERARALARRIELITQAAGVGVWSIDVDADIVEWNDQMFRIYGLPPGRDAPTMRHLMTQVVHVDDRGLVASQRTLASKVGHRGGLQFEFRIVRPDASERWLSTWWRREMSDGRVMAYGVTLDVTERRNAEVQLRDANERAVLAAESAGIGTWERDVRTGASVWNAQMYRLRGLAPESGLTPEQARLAAIHPDDTEDPEERFAHIVAKGVGFEREFRVVWPDGSVRWLAARGIVQRDALGQVERVRGVNWDITERKRAEQALRDKSSAEQASRAKSEFLSRMSHELRTPLNAVLGFAQLLQRDPDDRLNARQAERVDRIHSAGLHLMALIDDVLDLASIESDSLPLAREAVSVQAAVDDVLQWCAPQAQREGITLHVAGTPGWVRTDPRRLRQILANLLSNAIKYNRPQGQVWLDVQGCTLRGDASWQVRVRDSGRGLNAEQRAHLFEPFNRLGAEREDIPGTGIGLAIVHHLVQLMQGEIEVDSEPQQGSEFRVRLPSAPAPNLADAGERDAAQAAAAASADALSVLYIEDNPVNVMLVEELVAMRPNVRLLTAADGASGVALARAELPDVLLIDMQLPDFDGLEVLRRLKAEPSLSGRTFIALSASAMPDEVRSARAAGFSDYWTKPIDFAQFLAGLDALAAALNSPQGASRSRTQPAPARR